MIPELYAQSVEIMKVASTVYSNGMEHYDKSITIINKLTNDLIVDLKHVIEGNNGVKEKKHAKFILDNISRHLAGYNIEFNIVT